MAHKNFDLETFTYGGHTLRTVVIDGKWWAMSADIARALGVSLSSQAQHVRAATDNDEVLSLSRFDAPNEIRVVLH